MQQNPYLTQLVKEERVKDMLREQAKAQLIHESQESSESTAPLFTALTDAFKALAPQMQPRRHQRPVVDMSKPTPRMHS